jgi:MFS family permease
VILPFAAGYFVSYLFRSINAVIARPLAEDFNLGPAELGFMTSMYFLVFVLVQVPASAAIDRYGPRRIQAALMIVAAIGAALFSTADSLGVLMLGRALIGIGGSVALLTGLKAISQWGLPHTMALANGWLVMLGALGAVAATLPAEFLIDRVGWRTLFLALSVACGAIAALIYAIVPEQSKLDKRVRPRLRLTDIYNDARFWRIAPLSATTIAASWALQGLWASRWMSDVEGLTHSAIVNMLLAMALALSAGAFALGRSAHRLQRQGIAPSTLLVVISGVSMVAQTALALRLPLPAAASWAFVALAGASTVLSFASLATTYPPSCSARVNGALDLLHVGGAFVAQWAFGAIVQVWPEENGVPPIVAYQTAFSVLLVVQGLGVLSFVASSFRLRPTIFAAHRNHHPADRHTRAGHWFSGVDRSVRHWLIRVADARAHARPWLVATQSLLLLVLGYAVAVSAAVRGQQDVRRVTRFIPPPRAVRLNGSRLGRA